MEIEQTYSEKVGRPLDKRCSVVQARRIDYSRTWEDVGQGNADMLKCSAKPKNKNHLYP